MHIWPGAAYPLGATWDGWGTNFALFSEAAERVELCLLDEAGAATRVELTEGDVTWNEALFDYQWADPRRPNTANSATYMPKTTVINPFFDWGNDRPPR